MQCTVRGPSTIELSVTELSVTELSGVFNVITDHNPVGFGGSGVTTVLLTYIMTWGQLYQ